MRRRATRLGGRHVPAAVGRRERADASRLLFQSTFGARPADIDTVANRGTAGWIDDQLGISASQYTPRDWWPLNRPDTCVNNTTPPLTDASYCQRDNYSLFQPQREFLPSRPSTTTISCGGVWPLGLVPVLW